MEPSWLSATHWPTHSMSPGWYSTPSSRRPGSTRSIARLSRAAAGCCARYARSSGAVGIRQPTSPRLSIDFATALRCWMPWSPKASVPDYPGVLDDLHAARAGRPGALEALPGRRAARRSSPGELPQPGLAREHAVPGAGGAVGSCGARRAPRGHPFHARRIDAGDRLLPVRSGHRHRQRPRPGLPRLAFDTPPAVPEGAPTARLPAVPILLLSGERDLSTPLTWARVEVAMAPREDSSKSGARATPSNFKPAIPTLSDGGAVSQRPADRRPAPGANDSRRSTTPPSR